MSDGGKGDARRPLGVPMEQFDRNFDAIFGKKPVKTLKDYIEQKENQDEDKRKNNQGE